MRIRASPDGGRNQAALPDAAAVSATPWTAPEILARINVLDPINAATVRTLRRGISKDLAGADRECVVALALELVRSGDSNGRWVGYELILHHAGAARGITASQVEGLAEGLHDWGGVDSFGCYISGPAWREDRIGDARIHRWARSSDRWRRRAALVSTVPLNLRPRGGRGDAPRTLAVCELLLDDREDMVVKALSWALRALAVRDPDAVASFVEQYEERLAARVKREVRNKLRTGLKNPGRCPAAESAS